MKHAERIAIVHDWFQGFHGAERVVDAMVSDVFADFAKTDVLTFQAARDLLPEPLATAIVRESRLARLPGLRQRGTEPGRWRYLLPYMPRYFSHLPLEDYDVVISSSHSCAVNARAPVGVPHICYCYTPMRYIWMPETDADRVPWAAGIALRSLSGWLRKRDLRAAHGVDEYVGISSAVRDRIRQFYGRDARVIHPPVDIGDFHVGPKDPDHFVWMHRMVPYKRPEIVVEAFRGLSQRLTMIGIGPLADQLRAKLPANVELKGWLPRQEQARILATAGGFIHAAEEDFGMTMVEALAAGTPVIALRRGGAVDIVRDGQDGLLLDEPTVESVRTAVREMSTRSWDHAALAEGARRFSRETFVGRFQECVAEVLERSDR